MASRPTGSPPFASPCALARPGHLLDVGETKSPRPSSNGAPLPIFSPTRASKPTAPSSRSCPTARSSPARTTTCASCTARAAPLIFTRGSWTEFVSLARLHLTPAGPTWSVEQIRLYPDDPADEKLAALVRTTFAQHLTPEETAVVGRTSRALGPTDAALFAVRAAQTAAHADAAMIGGTTFGAGLPAGPVSRFAFDACVRFDGPLFVAEVDGVWLKKLLARTNQGPTPWAERAGKISSPPARPRIVGTRRYRFVTSDWAVKNAKNYFGDDAPAFTELPALKLKAAVRRALAPAP